MSRQFSVHLDTDIGDDIDDAFCLSLLLKSPEIELASISTVFLYTERRADLAREMCIAADRHTTIVPGLRGAMTRDGVRRWQERKLFHLPRKNYTHPDAENGILPLLQAARRECDALLTVGPMTNLAATLAMDPDVSKFPPVYAMAAEFQRDGHKEHNINVDVEAAAVCFGSGIPIHVIPWSIGPAVKLQPSDIEKLRGARNPVAAMLVDWLEQFWKHVPGKTNMYDPMTVVALLRPDLFEWQTGRVVVDTRGENTYGMTTFHRDEAGPQRVAMGVKADEARAFMVDRICA